MQEASHEASAAVSFDERHAAAARVERLVALSQRATNLLFLRLERHPPSAAIEAADGRAREMLAACARIAATAAEM